MKHNRLSVLPSSSPLRIVLAYALFGALWIIFSDVLMAQLVPEPLLETVSIAKGWLFIAVTALLLQLLIGRQLAEMAQVTAESRESEERLRLLGDNLPDSYVYQYLLEPDGTPRFLHLSIGVEKVHGVSRQDVLHDAGTLHREIDPEQLPALAAAEAASLQNMTDFQMELRMCRADGQWRWLQVRSRPRRRMDGQVLWDGVATDITARKQIEEKVRRLNEELEERVRERTAQLEAVNKELEAFSYSVSHDLKSPLRGIDGYSQLLEQEYHDRLDDEGRQFIQNIRHGSAQMHQLIEDLLAYSRMERRTLLSAAFDLQVMVQAVVAERATEVEQSGTLLRLEVPAISVRADRDGLAVVLRNLLENALKFSRTAQPPTVEIGARAEGNRAILWVRDNGIGFDVKFHDRIFEIFQRLQRAEDYPGTGIGLALVRKAMGRMGGRVWAESTPGQGATFFLEIPL